jgi:hypothetical protein
MNKNDGKILRLNRTTVRSLTSSELGRIAAGKRSFDPPPTSDGVDCNPKSMYPCNDPSDDYCGFYTAIGCVFIP